MDGIGIKLNKIAIMGIALPLSATLTTEVSVAMSVMVDRVTTDL